MREKALRIFKYLRELKRLSYKVVWDVTDYGYEPVWIDTIPEARGVTCAANSEDYADSGIWLEVKKQKLPQAPAPPSECLPWILNGLYDDCRTEPRLTENLQKDNSPELFEELIDHPGVKVAFEKYLRLQWRQWSAKVIEQLPAYELYNKLFEIHATLKKEGEKVELVLGTGLLIWRHNNQHIRRHVVVSSVQLSFDPLNGVISIGPALDGADTRFEHDFLQDLLQRDQINSVTDLADQIANVWDKGEIDPILNYITNLFPDSSFNSSSNHKVAFSDNPVVTWAQHFFFANVVTLHG
jgi:hypothetical protein